MSEQSIAQYLPLASLTIAENVRTSSGLDAASLKELAESIKTHGLMQPIIVAKAEDGTLHVVAGQRRTLASRIAGRTEILAIVTDSTDGIDLKARQIVENIQREDLSLADTCRGVREMLAMVGKPAAVQKQLGKSSAWVSKHLSPTSPSFNPQVRALIDGGKLHDIEMALILNQIAKHPNGGAAFELLIGAAELGELSRGEARKALDNLKQAKADDAEGEGDEGGDAEEQGEKFGKLELAEGPAKLLLAALKFAQAKKPSSRPGDALIAHIEGFILKTWPKEVTVTDDQGELPV
jgi:ParB/RepB/Spo0J family partition protein